MADTLTYGHLAHTSLVGRRMDAWPRPPANLLPASTALESSVEGREHAGSAGHASNGGNAAVSLFPTSSAPTAGSLCNRGVASAGNLAALTAKTRATATSRTRGRVNGVGQIPSTARKRMLPAKPGAAPRKADAGSTPGDGGRSSRPSMRTCESSTWKRCARRRGTAARSVAVTSNSRLEPGNPRTSTTAIAQAESADGFARHATEDWVRSTTTPTCSTRQPTTSVNGQGGFLSRTSSKGEER